MASLFEKKIGELKGVGEKRAKLFEKVGAPTVGALLRFYPRAYEDWSHPSPIASAPLNVPCPVRATVLSSPVESRVRAGMTLYKTTVSDGSLDLTITFFNNPYVKNFLVVGQEYLFYGKITGGFLHREMAVPEVCPIHAAPAISPVYRQTEGLSSRMIAGAVGQAIKLLPDPIKDPIPEDIRREYALCHLRFALENIHFPSTMEDLAVAKRRLIFEELLVLQLGLLHLKSRTRQDIHIHTIADHSKEFFELLPFAPTNAQRRAVAQALLDMGGEKAYAMSRLVQGDVGSGKTAVAAALCHSVVRSGMQATLMVPTEVLARQHCQSLRGFLEPCGMRVALLTGSLTPAKKRKLLEELKGGDIDLLVGTHAIISAGVEFKNLALVVTDEQHRFGVSQRTALAAKGENPHLLVMSATPIPRTLALMIYGDLDISVLDELPPGRQKIDTYAIRSTRRERAFGFIQQHIAQGYQCYMICPLVEEGKSDMASVQEYAGMLQTRFPGVTVGVLHGKMKPKEKEKVMGEFVDNAISILVSTTVVEVGVDVPNAVVMLIENAERYGLSQLHQLRGRVGRGPVKSSCILVSDAQNEEAITRLKVMCQTSDGFRIADEDLRLRGPGDFFGTNQHGLPDLKIANMMEDMETLQQAQEVAKEMLSQDADLSGDAHRGLRAQVRQLFRQVGEQGFN